jgi:hypothetical protein
VKPYDVVMPNSYGIPDNVSPLKDTGRVWIFDTELENWFNRKTEFPGE